MDQDITLKFDTKTIFYALKTFTFDYEAQTHPK